MPLPRPSKLSLCIAAFLGLLALPLSSPAQEQAAAPKVKIDWQDGPTVGKLGDLAEIKVPEGYRFAGADGTRKFLELTQNPPSGAELGVLIPERKEGEQVGEFWFVIFEFHEIGYVRDDDRDKLRADALLKELQTNTEEGNKERAKHGWPAYNIDGWYKPPFYDVSTKNLTWATHGHSVENGKDEKSVNYSIRILGRHGTMDVDLVLGPEVVDNVLPRFAEVLKGFSFKTGHSYAEFRRGDKVAEYGLAALVAGGATAIALKTGLLAKFWKLIVALFVALSAMIKRAVNYIKRVLTGKASEETTQSE
ncbi:MAG TPA: DUF2167 domain-containing protein [Candidatus Acidoferrum sp.]|nr:DUF2167 domain-containing protein [Candidatus Acidoferrum sp.]